MSDETKPKPSTTEEIEEKIAAIQQADKDARAARDAAERAKFLDEHPEWFTPSSFIVEAFPLVRASLPGHVVLRIPSVPEQQKFREACLGHGASVKGLALVELATRCRVYPEAELYREMVKTNPAIADQCANVVYRASEGKERDAGKG